MTNAHIRGYVLALTNVERISHDWQSIAYALRAADIDYTLALTAGCDDQDLQTVSEALRRYPRSKRKQPVMKKGRGLSK